MKKIKKYLVLLLLVSLIVLYGQKNEASAEFCEVDKSSSVCPNN